MSCLPRIHSGLNLSADYGVHSPVSDLSLQWDTEELVEPQELQKPMQSAILIAEDHFINAKIAFNSLKRFIPSSYIIWVDRAEQAQAALTGSEFIAKTLPSSQEDIVSRIWSATTFDVALLDFDLNSTISGVDVATAVRRYEQLNPSKRMTLMTFTSHYEKGQQLQNEHAALFDGIMPKPFSLEDINLNLKKYVQPMFWHPVSFTPSMTPRSLSRKSISPQTLSSSRADSSSLTSPINSPISIEDTLTSVEEIASAVASQLKLKDGQELI